MLKNILTASTAVLILALIFSYVSNAYTQAGQNSTETEQKTSQTTQKEERQKPKVNMVKTAEFYTRDGKLISGKLLSEDKNKITVERLEESTVVVSTYSKKEVDTRTLSIKKLPEYKYYLDLAEYFTGRTGDFKDDPDDFIQAIRCYEKAKQSILEAQDPDSEKIEQIDRSLQHLRADRELWTKEAQSRAELKKLEFEAEIESRIKELEDKVDAAIRQLNENAERFNKTAADMEDNYQKLREEITKMDEDFTRQLKILEDRIEDNRRLIDRSRRHPWLYRPYVPHQPPQQPK